MARMKVFFLKKHLKTPFLAQEAQTEKELKNLHLQRKILR
jgi:hypothetical protein